MLPKLTVRPGFARKTSDISLTESAMPLRPLSMSASVHTMDTFQAPPLTRTRGIRGFADAAADRSEQAVKTALPYWRETLAFAFAIAVISWLGVLTGRVHELEDAPLCTEVP